MPEINSCVHPLVCLSVSHRVIIPALDTLGTSTCTQAQLSVCINHEIQWKS